MGRGGNALIAGDTRACEIGSGGNGARAGSSARAQDLKAFEKTVTGVRPAQRAAISWWWSGTRRPWCRSNNLCGRGSVGSILLALPAWPTCSSSTWLKGTDKIGTKNWADEKQVSDRERAGIKPA